MWLSATSSVRFGDEIEVRVRVRGEEMASNEEWCVVLTEPEEILRDENYEPLPARYCTTTELLEVSLRASSPCPDEPTPVCSGHAMLCAELVDASCGTAEVGDLCVSIGVVDP
jgi:hypothetical protein